MEQIGPYRIQRELARGGMGVVYLAQGPDGRPVALKLLLAQRSESPQARRRFQVEVQALARLRHPHVVSILGAGEHQGVPWLALEFVQGETLAARLRRGPLPVEGAIGLALQLAQALDYVHACSVLHRDLKPDNVLLRGNEALLTDFGIARDLDASMSRLTSSGVFMGTPGYWPPEQAEGRTAEIGPRSDVYGLGAVLYACLTGRAPVEARTLQDYLSNSGSSPPPTRVLRPEVPPWLSELVASCLAFDPAQRPASADAVARALVVRERTSLLGPTPDSRRWVPGLVVGGVVSLALGGVVVALVGGGGDEAEPSRPAPREASPLPREAPPEPTGEAPPEPDPETMRWLERVLRLEGVGRSQEALQVLNQALEALPESADLYAARGQTLARHGRLDEAILDLNRAIELEPRHARALADRGGIHVQQRRLKQAEADLDLAIALAPGLREAHYYRGTVRYDLERDAEALADCEAELALQPQHAGALMTRGQLRLRAGDAEGALRDLDASAALNPGFGPLYYFRARAKGELGRHREAIEDFDRALDLDPGDGRTLQLRAEFKARLRDSEGGLRDCELAIRSGRENQPSAHILRGVLLTQLDRIEEAISAYDRALELDPRDPQALFVRGRLRRSRGLVKEALADFDRALELGLRDAQVHAQRGFALRQLRRNEEALEALGEAIRLDPSDAQSVGMRGTLLSLAGRHAEALLAYDRLVELTPEDAKAFLLRGEARYRRRRYAEALEDFERCERLGVSPAQRPLLERVRRAAAQALATPAEGAR